MTAQHPVKSPKKLIEVALPLDAINEAAAKEKSIRHGHPSTLHLWWARRPLAAARAVIFAQLVNDPSWKWELEHPEEIPPNNLKASWSASRKRLFAILEELVKWDNTTNEDVLEKARTEIRKSWRETCELNKDHPQVAELFNPDKLPAFHDPFAGGGALPLEAQRLGLEAHASDLNPVAVLITKAMIEIPPKFAGRGPVNPEARSNRDLVGREWKGPRGLAEDVRYYGQWIRDEAYKRIAHLYPPVEVTAEMTKERTDLKPLIGQKLTVIACLWARTVKSPNPAFRHVDVPLASTFVLSSKEGREAYVEPIVEGERYQFTVRIGQPAPGTKDGTKLARANFRCLLSGTPVSGDYIKAEGQAGRMATRLMAVIADSELGRVFLPPSPVMEIVARNAAPSWKPEGKVPARLTGGTCVPYGLTEWGDLFTSRQLVALTTLSDLVLAVLPTIKEAALSAGIPDDGVGLEDGGTGATAYAEAVAVYLGLAVSRTANTTNALVVWSQSREQSVNLFSRQAIPMTWDFPEVNVFGGAAGDFGATTASVAKTISRSLGLQAYASQADAQTQEISESKIISTDPLRVIPLFDGVAVAHVDGMRRV